MGNRGIPKLHEGGVVWEHIPCDALCYFTLLPIFSSTISPLIHIFSRLKTPSLTADHSVILRRFRRFIMMADTTSAFLSLFLAVPSFAIHSPCMLCFTRHADYLGVEGREGGGSMREEENIYLKSFAFSLSFLFCLPSSSHLLPPASLPSSFHPPRCRWCCALSRKALL